MADHITLRGALAEGYHTSDQTDAHPTDDSVVSNADVVAALQAAQDDLSVSSPVDGASDLGTAVQNDEVVVSGGGDEEFTKTSTDALAAALRSVEGVEDVSVDGGYEPAEDDADDADDDEE